MATANNIPAADASGAHQPTEFELRRAALVNEIGESLEQVLTQLNALNRSLEGIIEIGSEFSSVEALWSQFETVMGRAEENANGASNNTNDTANANANHEGEASASGR